MTKINTDIIYDQEHNLGLDTYIPDSEAKSTILVIHGGGWFRGDKTKDSDIGKYLADHGYSVVIPNYRLAPDYKYPAPLIDMDNVLNWIKDNDLNNHLIVMGSSVGGNMSVEMSIKYGLPAISLSGIFDIDDWLQHHESIIAKQDQKQNFTDSPSATINQSGKDNPFYKWFILNYLNNKDDALLATPYHRISKTTGPLFLANSLDEFVPNSGVLELANQLSFFQISFSLHMIPGTRHAKGYLDELWAEILSFIEKNNK